MPQGRSALGPAHQRRRRRRADADTRYDYSDEECLEDTDGHVLRGSRLPADWRFVWDWFALLEHRVVAAELKRLDTHDVRIGREPHDWWLEVKLDADPHLVREGDTLADNRVQRFRKLREAVLLLSIFAQVDYDSWVAELVLTAKFRPRRAMDLKLHKLPCKWAFDLSVAEFSIRICQWTMLRDLLDFKTLSKEFTRDFARAAALARAQGIVVEPIAVKAMRGLTEMATEMLALEAADATQRRDPAFKGPPVFRVERFTANFASCGLHPTVLNEIQRFLETGIPVHTLYLPQRSLDREMDAVEYLPAWGSLLLTIMANSNAKTVVRRLETSSSCCQGFFVQPLLSALMTAKTLEYVGVVSFAGDAGSDSISWRLWAWLGVAIFHSDSRSSIQALELHGYGLDKRCIRELRRAKEATNPLSHIWWACTEHEGDAPAQSLPRPFKSVTVMKGSKLSPQGYDNALFFVQDDSDETPTTEKLILPGYGLCTVERSALPNKRQRVQRNQDRHDDGTTYGHVSCLSTLVIHYSRGFGGRAHSNPHIAELLGVIDSSLTSLGILGDVYNASFTIVGIHGDKVDDASLQDGLIHCPRLENLRLEGFAIDSAQPLIQAYHHGVRISCLHLCALSIPQAALDQFLALVGSDESIRRHLIKLRFGSKWPTRFGEVTGYIWERMLTTNKCLQHLHVYQHTDTKEVDYLGISTFHHDPVPPRLLNRLAFLSVFRHLHLPLRFPGADAICNIFEFAVAERKFMVEERERLLRPGEFT